MVSRLVHFVHRLGLETWSPRSRSWSRDLKKTWQQHWIFLLEDISFNVDRVVIITSYRSWEYSDICSRCYNYILQWKKFDISRTCVTVCLCQKTIHACWWDLQQKVSGFLCVQLRFCFHLQRIKSSFLTIDAISYSTWQPSSHRVADNNLKLLCQCQRRSFLHVSFVSGFRFFQN